MKYENANWTPGPAGKQGYAGANVRAGQGAVLHSMEGSLEAALGELNKPERQASWHFSNPKAGPLLQHYEMEAVAWHAGGTANRRYVGIEHEGIAGEPLTESQIANDVGLLRWLGQQEGWGGFQRHETLFEHNEFMPTACPSGRIPWARIIAALTAVPAKILSSEESLRFATQVAYQLNHGRDMDEITAVVKYVYIAKGWPWPPAA